MPQKFKVLDESKIYTFVSLISVYAGLIIFLHKVRMVFIKTSFKCSNNLHWLKKIKIKMYDRLESDSYLTSFAVQPTIAKIILL